MTDDDGYAPIPDYFRHGNVKKCFDPPPTAMMYTTDLDQSRFPWVFRESEKTEPRSEDYRFVDDYKSKKLTTGTPVNTESTRKVNSDDEQVWYSADGDVSNYEQAIPTKTTIDNSEQESTSYRLCSHDPHLEPVRMEDVRLVRGPDDPSKPGASCQRHNQDQRGNQNQSHNQDQLRNVNVGQETNAGEHLSETFHSDVGDFSRQNTTPEDLLGNYDFPRASSSYHGGSRQVLDAELRDSGYGNSGDYIARDFSWLRRVGLLILGYVNAGKSSLMDYLVGLPSKHAKATPRKSDISTYTVTSGSGWKLLDRPINEILTDDSDLSTLGSMQTDSEERNLAIKISCLRGKFYHMHQMFLAPAMIYLLVMDITKDLDEVLEEDDASDMPEYHKTPREFLDYFLNNISTFNGTRHAQNSGESILIALTHTDKLDPQTRDDKIERYKQNVLEHIRKQHHRKNVEKTVFALSSKEESFDELGAIRDLISRLSYAKAEFGVPTDVWLQCEADMLAHCNESGKKYLSYADFEEEIAGRYEMSSQQVKELLKFHGKYGYIMYPDLGSHDSMIVTDPQLLVDAMKRIIQMKQSKDISKDTPNCTLDQQAKLKNELDRGILSGDCLSIIWDDPDVNKAQLAALMVNSSQFIPCEVEPANRSQRFESKKFIVPALLPLLDHTETDFSPFKKQPGIMTLVYLFHCSLNDDEIATSASLPSSFFFTLVNSLMKKTPNSKPWQVKQLYSNAVKFRAGTNRELLLKLSTQGCMIMLDAYSPVENKHRGSYKCAFSKARKRLDESVMNILRTYQNLHCSLCISPCDIIKDHEYSCLEILGTIGSVGDEPLPLAACLEHNKYVANELYSCWFCDKLDDDDLYKVDYGKVIRKIAGEIVDRSTLTHLAEELGIYRNEVERACHDHRGIKEATHSVLHTWENVTGGNIQQLKRALNTVGLRDILKEYV